MYGSHDYRVGCDSNPNSKSLFVIAWDVVPALKFYPLRVIIKTMETTTARTKEGHFCLCSIADVYFSM
jgi:hypothetical protein